MAILWETWPSLPLECSGSAPAVVLSIHAKGGGTPKSEVRAGFQIWINVPALHKMDAGGRGGILSCGIGCAYLQAG
jgi:hypothetical protein